MYQSHFFFFYEVRGLNQYVSSTQAHWQIFKKLRKYVSNRVSYAEMLWRLHANTAATYSLQTDWTQLTILVESMVLMPLNRFDAMTKLEQVGIPFIGNPDLIALRERGVPFVENIKANWYGGGAKDCTDYPAQ